MITQLFEFMRVSLLLKMLAASPGKRSRGHLIPQRKGRTRNAWKRDLKKEMWTAGFKFSWRKMKAAAQGRAGVWIETRVVRGLYCRNSYSLQA